MPSLDGSHTAQETTVQETGQRHRRTGLSIIIGVFMTSLTAAFLAEGQVFHNGNAQIFAFLALLAALGIGFLIAIAGFGEHRDRPLRSANQELLLEVSEFRTDLTYVMGLVAPIPGRLAAVEEAIAAVPEYGQGVVDGAQMRLSVEVSEPDSERR